MTDDVAFRRVRVGARSFLAQERKDGLWDKIEAGDWEPETEEILSQLSEGDLFIDIGAWIGWTTLAAAAHGATVVAFEPDPVSRTELEANIEANPGVRVTVVPVALSSRSGTRQLTAPYELGDSMGSIARHRPHADAGRATDVKVDDVRSWLSDFDGARLVKIDTEGAEYRILPAMRKWITEHRPDLLLSVHTYHLEGMLNRLPNQVRRASLQAATAALRARLRWLTTLYPYQSMAVEKKWHPLSATEFRRALNCPGEMEFYLHT